MGIITSIYYVTFHNNLKVGISQRNIRTKNEKQCIKQEMGIWQIDQNQKKQSALQGHKMKKESSSHDKARQ